MPPVLRWACVLLAVIACNGCDEAPAWSVARNGSILEVAYGSGRDSPQYAALHLESGYFRMNYGPGSGWGTSVVLVPSFWKGGVLYQGVPIDASWQARSRDLVIQIEGTASQLSFEVGLQISPPSGDSLTAVVTAITNGDVVLDDRPGEALKLVMLSSMHVSSDLWDAQSAFAEGQTFGIPESGWIVDPRVTGTRFGLRGGTSSWKVNAPTVEITLDAARSITGWVTPSSDPNDDNVGFWAASGEVIREWRYRIVARP